MNKEQIQQRLSDLLSSKIPLIFGENGTSFLGPSWIKTELVLEILKDAFNLGLEVAANNAEADVNIISTETGDYSEIYVLKESILKFKL